MEQDLLTKIVQFLPFYGILLFALSVHEAAHAWMAKQCGDLYATYEGRLTLNPLAHIDPIGTVLLPFLFLFSSGIPMFGYARPVPVIEGNLRRPSDMMWIALAGPASNIIMAVWSIVLLQVYWMLLSGAGPTSALPVELAEFFFYLVAINIILALFNMFPIPPLDGSRVFYHLFVFRNPRMQPMWEVVEQYGFTFFLILWFTGAFRVIFDPVFGWFIGQVSALLS